MSQQYDNSNPVGNPRIIAADAEGDEFQKFTSLLSRLITVPKVDVDEQRTANA